MTGFNRNSYRLIPGGYFVLIVCATLWRSLIFLLRPTSTSPKNWVNYIILSLNFSPFPQSRYSLFCMVTQFSWIAFLSHDN